MPLVKSRDQLFAEGVDLLERFCAKNALEVPEIRRTSRQDWSFDACAYYRPQYIAICVEKCAWPGRANRAWSWPGYVIDRTPYGVLQHELGHYIDHRFSAVKGSYYGDYSVGLRKETGEAPLTGYCPNTAEWFAEIFRLFVTNPELLRLMRPKTFALLSDRMYVVTKGSWRHVLKDAPERTLLAAARKCGELK